MRDPVSTFYNLIIPTVEETSARGSIRYDIFSRLLKERIIFVPGPCMTRRPSQGQARRCVDHSRSTICW